jgi:hypothetical protein
MGLWDTFGGWIETLIRGFNATAGEVIEGLLTFLTSVITRTPYPTMEGTNTPLVFGVPQDSLWSEMYGIYVGEAQPYAYILWFFAVVAVQFSSIFEGLLTELDSSESKRKLMAAFLGITLWWPIGVMILGFSDALGTLLLTLGTPGDSDSVGLARTYDIVMANQSDAADLPGFIILAILWLFELLILGVLALLWFFRIFLIYVGMPLMPIFIALWALEIPGLGALQTIGEKALTYFNTLAFITIPGAVLVGFTGPIIRIASQNLSTDENPVKEPEKAGGGEGGGTSNGGEYDGGTGGGGGDRIERSLAGEPVDGGGAMTDPVGAFASAVRPSTDGTSGGVAPATAQPVVESGAPQAGIVSGMSGIGDFALGFLLALVMLTIPIIAALGPFLIAKLGIGAGIGFLANPVGAAMGAATSVGGALDSKDAVTDGFRMAKAKASDSEEVSEEYSDLLNDDGELQDWSSLGGDRVDRIQDAHSAGGVGAALATGMSGASTARNKGGNAASRGKTAAKRAGNKGLQLGLDARHNPKEMMGVGVNNAKQSYLNTKDSVSDTWRSGVQTTFNTPAQAKDRVNARYDSATTKLGQARGAVNIQSRASADMNEHMVRTKWEMTKSDRRQTEREEMLQERFGYNVSSLEEVKSAMTGEEGEYRVSADALPDFERTTVDELTKSQVEEHYDGVSLESLAATDVDTEEILQPVVDEINEQEIEAFREEELDKEALVKKLAESQSGIEVNSPDDLEVELNNEIEDLDIDIDDFSLQPEDPVERDFNRMVDDLMNDNDVDTLQAGPSSTSFNPN